MTDTMNTTSRHIPVDGNNNEQKITTKFLQECYKEGSVYFETANIYNQYANDNQYDQLLNKELYKGPTIAAMTVAEFYPQVTRKTTKILDVAAGTGFVAEFLREAGFTDIDALDPSEGMLEKARNKLLYNSYICTFLDDKKLPLLQDTYDCAVISGGMGEGHIPWVGLDELTRVVKTGGLVCIVMREAYLNASQYKDKLEPHMNKLVHDGKWRLESRTVVPKYCMQHNGLVYKFIVTK